MIAGNIRTKDWHGVPRRAVRRTGGLVRWMGRALTPFLLLAILGVLSNIYSEQREQTKILESQRCAAFGIGLIDLQAEWVAPRDWRLYPSEDSYLRHAARILAAEDVCPWQTEFDKMVDVRVRKFLGDADWRRALLKLK